MSENTEPTEEKAAPSIAQALLRSGGEWTREAREAWEREIALRRAWHQRTVQGWPCPTCGIPVTVRTVNYLAWSARGEALGWHITATCDQGHASSIGDPDTGLSYGEFLDVVKSELGVTIP